MWLFGALLFGRGMKGERALEYDNIIRCTFVGDRKFYTNRFANSD